MLSADGRGDCPRFRMAYGGLTIPPPARYRTRRTDQFGQFEIPNSQRAMGAGVTKMVDCTLSMSRPGGRGVLVLHASFFDLDRAGGNPVNMGAMTDRNDPPQDSPPDLPFAGRLALAFGGLILVFCSGLLAAATVALWVGSPPWPASTPLAALLTTVVAVVWARRISSDRSTAAAALVAGAGLTIVLSAVLGGGILDTSFDGQWYHQEAVLKIVEGWNPIRTELSLADYPDNRVRRQVNGYPKASWMWGAALVRFSHHMEHAKAMSIPLMVAAAAMAFAALLGLARIPWWLALGTAAAAAANPVAITQTLNTQLDGDLASLQLIAVSALIICGRTRCRRGLVVLTLAVAVGVNLKLTAPAYFVLLSAAGLFGLALVGPPQVLRRLIAVFVAAFITGMAVVGFHPYVTNTIRHGHPLYPVMGPEKFTLVEEAETNRAVLLFRSVFSPSRQVARESDVDHALMDSPLKLPFTVAPSEVDVFLMPDVRVGGWGPLFGGLCLLAVAGLAAAGLKDLRWLVLGLAITLPVLVSVLIMPHPWFARFAPQGWLLPVVIIPLAWAAGGKMSRLLAVLAAGTALVNAAVVTTGYLPATVRHSALIESRIDRLRLLGQPLVLNLMPFPSNRARLAEMGIAFDEVRDPDALLQLVLGRFQPRLTSVLPEPDLGILHLRWTEVPQATHYQVAILLPPPAGPGGGSLSVVRRSSTGPSASVPVANGEFRVLLSPCNTVACGPPYVSDPMAISGVRRSLPLIGSPEDGSTVAGPRVLLSWLPAEGGPMADRARATTITYRVTVEHARTGELVVDESTEGLSLPVLLTPNGDWIARIDVVGAEPPRRASPVLFHTPEPIGPEITQPATRSTVREGAIELRWSGVAGACGYDYFVAVPGRRRPTASGTTTSTSQRILVTSRTTGPTVHHAIVRARFCDEGSHSMDFWGPWSSEVGFGPTEFTVLPAVSPAPSSR